MDRSAPETASGWASVHPGALLSESPRSLLVSYEWKEKRVRTLQPRSWIYTPIMPLLVVQDGNSISSNPEIGHAALMVASLLAAIGVLLLVLTLFWINRRMKKALGLHGQRSGLGREDDHRDPWIEAGQRIDEANLESLYEGGNDDSAEP